MTWDTAFHTNSHPLEQTPQLLSFIVGHEVAVSKDGQQARCAFPPFETHRCAMLLRVRLSGLFIAS
jgi:hypothetical protein